MDRTRTPEHNDATNSALDEQTRREFVRSAAVKAALVALFGATSLDAVVARTTEELGSRRLAEQQGRAAADDMAARLGNTELRSVCTYAVRKGEPLRTPLYACGVGQQVCQVNFTCGGGGQHYSCYDLPFTCKQQFRCYDFGCKESTYDCESFTCAPGTEFNTYP